MAPPWDVGSSHSDWIYYRWEMRLNQEECQAISKRGWRIVPKLTVSHSITHVRVTIGDVSRVRRVPIRVTSYLQIGAIKLIARQSYSSQKKRDCLKNCRSALLLSPTRRIVSCSDDYSEQNNSVHHRKKRNTLGEGGTRRGGMQVRPNEPSFFGKRSRYRSILSLFYD